MSESAVRRSSGSLQKPRVSVLTATIPGREHLLVENQASVRSQTMKDWEHLTYLDVDRRGCSYSYNLLAREAEAAWLFIIADDDLLLPSCLHKHLQHVGAGDIIYSPPLVWGEAPDQFCMSHPNIPAVALIRRDLWDTLGGYDESLGGTEDRDFYQRAERARARFVRFVDGPVWVYRFHETDRVGNKSRNRTT